MARLARFVLPGAPHHVLQHGHDGAAIVRDDEDRRQWLAALREATSAHGVDVHAWLLLDDHFHLIATPAAADGLARALQALGRRYVAAFNRRHGRSGTLWQGRFQAAVVEAEPWLLRCMRFVETHPSRAMPPLDPLEHRWSSLPHHLGLIVDPLVRDHPRYWALGNTPFERHAAYARFLEQGPGPAELAFITAATRRGRPVGSPEFVAGLETQTARPLSPRPRGRPRKPALT